MLNPTEVTCREDLEITPISSSSPAAMPNIRDIGSNDFASWHLEGGSPEMVSNKLMSFRR